MTSTKTPGRRQHLRPDGTFLKQCHQCPVSAAIQAGKHKRTPWAKMPCRTCQLSKRENGHGQRNVELDKGHTTAGNTGLTKGEWDLRKRDERWGGFSLHDVLPGSDARGTMADEIDALLGHAPGPAAEQKRQDREAMLEVFRDLLDMTPRQREAVLAKILKPYGGVTGYARSARVTKQAASNAIRTAAEKYRWVKRAVQHTQGAK